jgi:hypothetical protein
MHFGSAKLPVTVPRSGFHLDAIFLEFSQKLFKNTPLLDPCTIVAGVRPKISRNFQELGVGLQYPFDMVDPDETKFPHPRNEQIGILDHDHFSSSLHPCQ